MDPRSVTFPLAFLAGLISFASPCVLPLVPAYVGYISGSALGEAGAAARVRTFFHALAFVAGFTAIFSLLGGGVGLLGSLYTQYLPWVQRAGGLILIVFGLHTVGLIRIPWLYYEKRFEMQAKREWGYLSSLLIGVVFAIGWTPCVSQVLTLILVLASDSGTAWTGTTLLFVYSLGLGIPFLLTGLALGRAAILLKRLNRYAGAISLGSGLLMIGFGVVIFTGSITRLIALLPWWQMPL